MPEPIPIMKFVSNFRIGGTERQFVLAAANLDRRRFRLHVGCFHRMGDFLDDVERAGLPVSEYAIRRLYDVHSLRERLRLARYIRQHGIQLVHAYGFYPNLFAVPAARLAGARAVIASIRDSGDLWTALQRRAQRAILRLADHVVVNAQAVADVLTREGYDRRKLSVIRNGIRAAVPGTRPDGRLRTQLRIPESAPVVTVVSRLTQNDGYEFKGIHHFLDAVASLRDRFGGARFLIVGDGPSRADLEAHAARVGIADRVTFAGFRLDIPDILATSTIAVLPSLSEGLSNSLLEAMAAGLPVVATRVGGNPEAVGEGEGGLLVPPGDDRALAEAIATLLVNVTLRVRLGHAARRRVDRLFSVNRMLQETETLYRDLMERRRAS
jgi:glycosyltransferase involved in cell wall biosynthesis